MPTNCLNCAVVMFVLLLFITTCGCFKKPVLSKVKRKADNFDSIVVRNDLFQRETVENLSQKETGRGFFVPGLFSLGKVLNFFPVGGERECQPSGYTIARTGICLNQYDCRQRDGRAAGDCAHGLGVCCVFETSCGGTAQNNLTYFMSPGFPELWTGGRDCDITIEKTHAGITQLKIDFVHFTIGQPNRTTGECDEDAMILGEGQTKLEFCGQNHGQHIYYTLPTGSEVREDGELPNTKSTRLSIRMRGSETPRLWLLRLAQMPLAYSAPHDCLQYYTGNNGTIRTFNFASNGRHLAGQEYRACVRRNTGRCTIRYSPCDKRSFRIGPGRSTANTYAGPIATENGPGGLGGSGTGFYGPDGQFISVVPSTTPRINYTEDLAAEETQTQNGTMDQEQLMPVGDLMQDEEGSGSDPSIAPVVEDSVSPPSIASRIWSFIFPSWLWGQRSSARTFEWSRWSPYAQHYIPEDDNFRYNGYGNFGVGLQGYGRQRCTDRITIPCENEYFVSSTTYITGVCDPHHCGSSFCRGGGADCHVETSITPFAVSVHFGPPAPKKNPEENIGACLKYTQLLCDP